MEKARKKYLAKLDCRNRLTVRDSKYEFYHVTELDDGTIILKPKVENDSNELSKSTLTMIDDSIKNFNKGVVSEPINIDKYLNIVGPE